MEKSTVARHRLVEYDTDLLTGVCSSCGPVEIKIRKERNGRRAVCSVARREQRRHKTGADRTEATSKQARDWRLRKRYGITSEQYDAMVLAQNGVCAICETEAALVVDHNHLNGAVRALLCQPCNVGMGFLGDSPARLISAAVYLQAFSSERA